MAENLKEILSPRQYEVAVGIAQGLDNGMGTTAGNISVLLTTICKRLGIKSKDGISLREQLVDYVNENMYASFDKDKEQLSNDIEKVANDNTVSNIHRISESVEHVEIVQKINRKLDELYLYIGKEYVNGSVHNDRDVKIVQKAREYKTALDVIDEVMSCKE